MVHSLHSSGRGLGVSHLLSWVTPLGEGGNDAVALAYDRLDCAPVGRASSVALQPRLGLLSQRVGRHGAVDYRHSVAVGAYLDLRFLL
jgi:hypothetical protein